VQVTGGTCASAPVSGTIQIVQGSPGLTSLGGHQSGYALVGGINFPIEDDAQGSSFEGISIYSGSNGNATFGGVLWIDNDQAAKVTNIESNSYPYLMTPDYQSAYLFSPGPENLNSGILYGSKLDLSGQAVINCVNWYSGNDFSLEDSVCQGYENYGYKISKAGGGYGNVTLKHMHDETGGVSNAIDPALGTAGMIDQGYNVVRTGPMGFVNAWPIVSTSTSGQALTVWYLVYRHGSTESVPIPIAYGNVTDPSNSSSCGGPCATTIKYFVPHYDGVMTSPDSADILRVTAPNMVDASVIAPNGNGNYLVANVAFNATNCNAKGVCLWIDSVAPGSLGNYNVVTIDANGVVDPFYPWIEFAPGGLVMSNAANTFSGPFSGWPTYSGTYVCINSPTPVSIPLFTINETATLGGIAGACLATAKSYIFLSPPGSCCALYPATFFNNAPQKGGIILGSPQTGRLNFGMPNPTLSVDTETIWDSNSSLTEQVGYSGTSNGGFALGRRALLPADIGLGTEGNGSGSIVGLQIHGGTDAINLYVNHVPDNASWLEQVTPGGVAIATHLNQGATGNFAGTCMMSGTTCTITLAASYMHTPGCVATIQGTVVIAGACNVSGSTITITAASSNTYTWAAMVFGNPN